MLFYDPAELRKFSANLLLFSEHAAIAASYTHQHTDVQFDTVGLLALLQSGHTEYVQRLADNGAHLQALLRAAAEGVNAAAAYYEHTDQSNVRLFDEQLGAG